MSVSDHGAIASFDTRAAMLVIYPPVFIIF
jgi:hypothetical protein